MMDFRSAIFAWMGDILSNLERENLFVTASRVSHAPTFWNEVCSRGELFSAKSWRESDSIADPSKAACTLKFKLSRDPFRFHFRGRRPRRYNHGAKIEGEQVEITASGGAMPLPNSVNY